MSASARPPAAPDSDAVEREVAGGTRADSGRAVEQRLLRRWHYRGDRAAREELVRRLRPLATRLANRYGHTSESQEDLRQVASVGLLKAIDGYDPEAGPFVRYAVPTILGELRRHFRDNGWGVRVPRSLQERALAVSSAVERLAGRRGRNPTTAEVAEATDLTIEQVEEAVDVGNAYRPTALEELRPADEEDRPAEELVEGEEPGFARVEIGADVGPAFHELSERDRRVVRLRVVEDLTQSEIAQRTGISQMHVSRILSAAAKRLRVAAGRD